MDTQKSVLLIVAVLVAGLFTGYAFLGKSTPTGELESTPTGELARKFIIDTGGGSPLTCACKDSGRIYSGCRYVSDDKRWVDCGGGPVGCYDGWHCW